MLKKITLLALALLLFSIPGFAQQNSVRLDAAGNGDFVMAPAVRVGYSQWIDIYNYGFTSHRLTYRPVGSPASFTLTLECSNTGSDTATSVLGTGTTVTGGAITATGTTCTRVRWHLSALSGTVTLYLTYHGAFDAAGAAATVAISQAGAENQIAFAAPQHVIVDSGGGGGTQYTNDVALTIASTVGTEALCRASAAAPTNVSASDDAALLWCLLSGALATQPTYGGVLGVAGNGASGTGVPRVTIANDSTGIIALTTSTASIGKLAANSGIDIGDVDVTSIIPGVGATNLAKAEDGTPANGDTIVPGGCIVQATLSATTSDTKYGIPKCNANSALYFQNVFQTAADAAEDTAVATSPVPIGGIYRTTSVGLDNGDVGYPRIDVDAFFQVNGSVAHDVADSGAPLKIGFKATTSISAKTMVASDDRTDAFSGIDGIPIFREHANLEDRVTTTPVAVTDGSSTSLIAAQGSGIRFCATTITVSNSSATNVTVDIRDGTAGAVLWTMPAAANMGGYSESFPIPVCTTANTAMATDPSAAASTVTTSVIGFKTKL